ncbi:DUF5985 family protein [Myxococcus sp. K15C18031901]|uniref:DUF5985 family protein n=1 Tax=Myxococcus dinghuensis TaxID=2906761 RepID=UPI0020A7AF23|nr:DUF5985 family protein [Myxococcus dinghuensis]MCP3100927.1 DUF5985 family protein [Myxococcus dinghuensis]
MLRSMLNGAVAMGWLACALFFLRFWKQSRERLFAFFSGAFVLLAVNSVAAALMDSLDERRYYLYLARLVAFLVILYAIWDKNRSSRQGGG